MPDFDASKAEELVEIPSPLSGLMDWELSALQDGFLYYGDEMTLDEFMAVYRKHLVKWLEMKDNARP